MVMAHKSRTGLSDLAIEDRFMVSAQSRLIGFSSCKRPGPSYSYLARLQATRFVYFKFATLELESQETFWLFLIF